MRRNLWSRMFSVILCIAAIIGGNSRVEPVYAEGPQPVRIERTVSTTVTEVGEKFTVNYRIFGDEIKIPRTANEIAVIIDTSGSMAYALDGKSTTDESQRRITIAKKGAKNFISNFKNTNTKIFVVPFDSQVRELSGFEDMTASGSLTKLNSYIEKLKANGGTNLGDSFRIAYQTLEDKGSAGARKHIVVLTDGDPTFYSYTGTVGKSSFAYYMGKGLVGTVSGVRINSGNDFDRGFAYAGVMGGYLRCQRTGSGNQKFNFHIIGFADNSASLDAKLDEIGATCGAEAVPTNSSKHYYKALTENDLKAAYDAIWRRITQPIAFGVLHFQEILPADVVLTPESQKMLNDNHFTVKTIQMDGKERVQISGNLSGSMEYKRSESDGDIYQLKEQLLSFEISVMAEKAGKKMFEKNITTIDYVYCTPDSPDNAISGTASNENECWVTINRKDSELEMSGSLNVLQGCTANLRAAVTLGDPEDVTVDTWSSQDAGEIINIVKKEKNTAAITGLKCGRTIVKATTKSAKDWYEEATAECSVNIIGVETRNIYLLKGSTSPGAMPLEKYLAITVPGGVSFDRTGIKLENVRFGAGETVSGGLKTDKDGFVQVDTSNNQIKGLDSTGDSFITLKADIKYGDEQIRTLDWKVYVINAEITPVELNVEVWGAGQFDVNYKVPSGIAGLDPGEMARIDGKLNVSWSCAGTDISVKDEDVDIDGRIDKLIVKGVKLTGNAGTAIEVKVSYRDSLHGVPVQEKTISRKVIVGKSAVDVQ